MHTFVIYIKICFTGRPLGQQEVHVTHKSYSYKNIPFSALCDINRKFTYPCDINPRGMIYIDYYITNFISHSILARSRCLSAR